MGATPRLGPELQHLMGPAAADLAAVQVDGERLAGGVNLYAYAGNNPVMFTDPFGLWPSLAWTLVPQVASAIIQVVGAARDFVRNHDDMVKASTIGGDKYFHCKANCEATRRGSVGEATAEGLSDLREITDVLRGKAPPDSSVPDQEANRAGRDGAKANPEKPCTDVCAPRRPRGLPEEY